MAKREEPNIVYHVIYIVNKSEGRRNAAADVRAALMEHVVVSKANDI